MINKIIRLLKRVKEDPKKIVIYGLLVAGKILPDKWYLQLQWWAHTGNRLHLQHPQGFNEKLQWLKLYNRRPEYTALADKYTVRNFITKTIGKEYLIPLLGVWENANDIPFDTLPNQFVLKCTHNSGEGMCLCKDKKRLNIPLVKHNLQQALRKNYYYNSREWPYKHIKPRIIAEHFLIDTTPDNTLGTLIDYKFYCFNGEPKFLYVGADDISQGIKGELRLSVLDLDWKPVAFRRPDHQPLPIFPQKPAQLDTMIKIARQLSRHIPFVRVDLYEVNGQVFFSELTFYPAAGYGLFSPATWENTIGSWLSLPPRVQG